MISKLERQKHLYNYSLANNYRVIIHATEKHNAFQTNEITTDCFIEKSKRIFNIYFTILKCLGGWKKRKNSPNIKTM